MNIEIELSPESVKAAIAKLEAYKDSLRDRNDEFVKKLAEIGIPIIHKNVNAAGDVLEPSRDGVDFGPDLGTDTSHAVTLELQSFGPHCKGTLTLSGKDILFIEFGAGITYNPTDPEHAAEFGYGVGTYPGQTNAYKENGWWFDGEYGKVHTYGTKATSPMLQASKEMILKIREIAREVYGS